MTLKADILIVDGRHLLWRTTDVHKDLFVVIDGEDVLTGGMYGFLNVLIRIHARYGGQVIVTWEGQGVRDDGSPRPRNFRFDLLPSYKHKDEEIPDDRMAFIIEMMVQERRLQDFLAAIGVQQYMGIACEGDDATGTLSKHYAEQGCTVVIYSGDSDLRQLVRPGVFIAAPNKGPRAQGDKLYDVAAVEKKHMVPPPLMAQLKALAGGKDNIPGVGGVGPKYAAKLLTHYGSLDKVLRAAINQSDDWPLSTRLRDAVAASAADVILYYKVSKIRTDVELEYIEPIHDQSLVMYLLRMYRFQSLAAPVELNALMKLGS